MSYNLKQFTIEDLIKLVNVYVDEPFNIDENHAVFSDNYISFTVMLCGEPNDPAKYYYMGYLTDNLDFGLDKVKFNHYIGIFDLDSETKYVNTVKDILKNHGIDTNIL